MIEAFDALRSGLAVSTACQALGVPRSSLYRARQRRSESIRTRRRVRPPLALSGAEREGVLAVLNMEFPGFSGDLLSPYDLSFRTRQG